MNTVDPILYSRHNLVQRQLAKMAWSVMISSDETLSNFQNVLDLGCGSGNVTRELAHLLEEYIDNKRHSISVTGVDISPEMINFCQEQQRRIDNETNLTTIKYCIGDFDEPFPQAWNWSSCFDLVTSHCALHYSKNLKTAMENVHSALKNKGRFLFVLPFGMTKSLIKAGREVAKRWSPYVPENIMDSFGPSANCLGENGDNFKRLLTDVGLEIRVSTIKRLCYVFMDLCEMRGLLESLSPHWRYIPEYLKEEFLNDLTEDFKKACLWVSVKGVEKPTFDGEYLIVYGEKT